MINDPGSDFASKVAANIITEIFKSFWSSFKDIPGWIQEKYNETDPFGMEGQKYTEFIDQKYDNMRIIGMSKPVTLSDIYINIRVLNEISSKSRKNVEELQLLYDQNQLRSDGEMLNGSQLIEKSKYSMVLGKPGAGKTTFLKHLALEAIRGKLTTNLIPIFIILRDWVDSGRDLEEFVIFQFKDCHLKDSDLFVKALLLSGKCLMLLDGYDELGLETDRATKEINKFIDKYKENKYVLSCRISANTYVFERFVEVEIADFDDTQINSFINKWMGEDGKTATKCWNELCLDENKRIKELAKTPLLITLICLAYTETISFSPNRAELYEDALDALLKKWDSSRTIKREDLYKNLTVKKKELLFSRIASRTFEEGNIFLKEKDLVSQIDIFMTNLIPDQYSENGFQVLKSIETQHGLLVERAHKIYSFSHLTFQEYFTAKYIAESTNRGATRELIANHLFDRRWFEVIILTSAILPEADDFLLLIREKISKIPLSKCMLNVFSGLEEVINKEILFPNAIKRAIALKKFLEELDQIPPYTFGYVSSLSTCEKLIQELFDSYKIYINPDLVEIKTLNLGSAEARKKIKELTLFIDPSSLHSFWESIERYLYATQVFVECILADCYVNKKIREELLNSFLQEPWSTTNITWNSPSLDSDYDYD